MSEELLGELIVILALALLVVLVWKPVRRAVLGGLDDHARKIRAELEEAQRLHEEAKALLAKHQRLLHEGEGLARDILARAEEEVARLERRAREEFEQLVQRRQKQAEERIVQERNRAIAEIRSRTVEVAMAATREVLRERLGEERGRALLDQAVDEVTRRLH